MYVNMVQLVLIFVPHHITIVIVYQRISKENGANKIQVSLLTRKLDTLNEIRSLAVFIQGRDDKEMKKSPSENFE